MKNRLNVISRDSQMTHTDTWKIFVRHRLKKVLGGELQPQSLRVDVTGKKYIIFHI